MVRAALRSRAQQIRSAQSSTVFIFGSHVRTRACLTPTFVAALLGRAASFGLWMPCTASLGLPSRVRRAVQPIEWLACNPIVIGWRMSFCARWSGMNETRKLAPAAAGRWFASLKTTNCNNWRTVVTHPVRLFGFQRFRISVFSIFPVASPSRHLPPAKYRHGSARARFGKPDSGLTRQLYSRSTPFHSIFTSSISVPLRSDGRKLSRQSGIKSCAPE
jgi:hypothetical protein